MAAICTPTPGGKPAPGFTFGIARPLLGPATMSKVNEEEAANASSGKLSKGFDFLGYRVVPGRRLRSSAESKRRFAEKFRRLYEQGAGWLQLWRTPSDGGAGTGPDWMDR